jgi:hypothetical protein
MTSRLAPCHQWGDDFDWKALDEAGYYIQESVKWCRLGIHWKEKYGTLRVSPWFFNGTLHSLIYPNCAYSWFPGWLWRFDIEVLSKFLGIFKRPIQYIQTKVLKRAYKKAVEKWPHIKKEILEDYPLPDYDEFLTECGWTED